jgi:nucleotide-binding universal stress UspA family protein
MILNILVPTDGSEVAQKAARYTSTPAKQLKCSVIALSVIDNRPLMTQTISAQENFRHILEPIEDCLRVAAEEYAREIKEICSENGVRSKILIALGHPAEEIA